MRLKRSAKTTQRISIQKPYSIQIKEGRFQIYKNKKLKHTTATRGGAELWVLNDRAKKSVWPEYINTE